MRRSRLHEPVIALAVIAASVADKLIRGMIEMFGKIAIAAGLRPQ